MSEFDAAPLGPTDGTHPTERLDAPTDPASAPSGDRAVDPLIGLLVDSRYRVVRRIARGGMATVYVAQDERLDRPVALKVMHPHLAESADFVARFRREARAAARIIHPGVVSVFDQGVVHGQGFLVMELIEGPSLREVLRREGALPLGEALRCIRDVLDALRAAHRVGVVHRDIKPENVLVPSDPPVRVADFGLARAASEVSMSSTGSMLGTIAYIAPEVALSKTIDERTDLYAVGIMAYEMLAGRVPWEGENPLAIAQHHVNDEVPPLSEGLPWIPREVDDFIASLAAKDPDERPADAAEALEALARARAAIPADALVMRADIAPRPIAAVGETTTWDREEITSSMPDRIRATSEAVVRASAHSPSLRAGARKRSIVGRVIALLAVLALVGSVGGWWWWTEYGPGSYLDMPATENRAERAVESELAALGLGVVSERAFSDTVPEGSVISSDPAGGQPVHKNGEVRLVVSKGVDMRSVPDLIGVGKDQAALLLSDAGLQVGKTTEEYSETVEQGSVVSQAVEAATSIPHDTAVDFVVSKGREPIEVPALSEQTAEAAKAAIEAAGLVANPTEEFSDTVAAGTVISQSTQAGSTLHKGDSVSYVVSKGPELVAVPSVTGKQEGQAVAALEAAGFQVKVSRVLGGVFGTARYTDPDAGTMARRGSTVTLFVV